ncbi:MAG: hypothetical protein ACRYF3_12440 [Janthinobacterium lividum]
MSKQWSRVCRAAEYIGLVEDPSTAPQRGSRAWWRRALLIVAVVVAATVVKALVS